VDGKNKVYIQLNKQSAVMTFLIKQCRGRNNIFCHWLLIFLYMFHYAQSLALQEISYVPKTVTNVPAYCVGIDGEENCYHTCFLSTTDESEYVCLFLKLQDASYKHHFVNIEFLEPKINIKAKLFLPNRFEDAISYYCNLYDISPEICYDEKDGIFAHAKARFDAVLKRRAADLYLSGGYKEKASSSVHFFFNSKVDNNVLNSDGPPSSPLTRTNLFASIVFSPSILNIHANTELIIENTNIIVGEVLCKEFKFPTHLCVNIQKTLGMVTYDQVTDDTLFFKRLKQSDLQFKHYNLIVPSSISDANSGIDETEILNRLYMFCVNNQCAPHYFKSINNLIKTYLKNKHHKKSMLELGLNAGTDKVFWHGYQRLYKRHLEPYRHKPIRLLEIGLRDGASLDLWSNYLHPDSEIYGIDYGSIDPTCQPCKIETAFCFHGDQENRTFLNSILKKSGGNFDIIIDDGGHGYQQQMVSFEVLFKNGLKPGGIYFIEDIETSYWTDYEQYGNVVKGGKNHPNAPLTMFLQMVHVVNREFHNHSDYVFFPLDRLIESLSFSHNIIEITKLNRFPDVYDDRLYRYKYTINKYGAAWWVGHLP
jgi:hypothetical protein